MDVKLLALCFIDGLPSFFILCPLVKFLALSLYISVLYQGSADFGGM